jgi:hypothetical protein
MAIQGPGIEARETRTVLGTRTLTPEGASYRASLPPQAIRDDPVLSATADVTYWSDGPGRVLITPVEIPVGELEGEQLRVLRTGSLVPNGSSVRASIPASAIDDDPALAGADSIVVFHEGAGRLAIESREQPRR